MSERKGAVKKIPVTAEIILPEVAPEIMLVRGVADCPQHGEGVYFEREKKGEDLFVCAICRNERKDNNSKRDRLPFLGLRNGK